MKILGKIGSLVIAMAFVGLLFMPGVSASSGSYAPSSMWNAYSDWENNQGGTVNYLTHAVMQDQGYLDARYNSAAQGGARIQVFTFTGKAVDLPSVTTGSYALEAYWMLSYTFGFYDLSGKSNGHLMAGIEIFDNSAGGTMIFFQTQSIADVYGFNVATAVNQVTIHRVTGVSLTAGHSYTVCCFIKSDCTAISEKWWQSTTESFTLSGALSYLSYAQQ